MIPLWLAIGLVIACLAVGEAHGRVRLAGRLTALQADHDALTTDYAALCDMFGDHVRQCGHAPTVWSDAAAPGGRVCAVPVPGLPDGICGEPVESTPCPEHRPAEVDDAYATLPNGIGGDR